MTSTYVLFWWNGKAEFGIWKGYHSNGNFLVDALDTNYDHPVESKLIYPYVRQWVGKEWNSIPELKEAYDATVRKDN